MSHHADNGHAVKISARDGYELGATVWEPSGPVKGVVQIHSGTGIPQELYHHFAAYVSRQGYTSITFDYRGIGKSRPKKLKGFPALMRDWGQQDMTGVMDWVQKNYSDKKKTIIGHSVGGQLIGLMPNHHLADKLGFVATSTGYWKHMGQPLRWMMPAIWNLVVPAHNTLFGHVKLKRWGLGEDLPKGVVKEWKEWCQHPRYFEPHFNDTLKPLYFDLVRQPIHSLYFSDDPIANDTTSRDILKFYPNAPKTVQRVSPREIGVKKIGHAGFFSRRMKDKLWDPFLQAVS